MTTPEPLLSLTVAEDGQATLSHLLTPEDAANILDQVARSLRSGDLQDCTDPDCQETPEITSAHD